ncbi:CCA tRNA nucleotidyltransferase [Roseimicrobium sp. ORNL1]|uniref:CCA tRNA nucleotidyltransferase n=1 Tax=Roseimicrobium sp. ORNL1 TaxID=2711231 RepID=UPI0013E1CE2A|nr:CCA tRNA nucleotidyltransferase [Roseimicrobium sp. ORNL1]QIF03605.1 CCA tRNA nucleotidyltransferase [Roseimicrobium sp. ORNL1]
MRNAATNVVRALVKAGHEAVFAGGCVRDTLRGVEPKDYDVATSARPEQVQALFAQSVPVGAHFGVIIVRMGPHQIEVATFRRDGAYSDGRRPDSVKFTSAVEDAKRRDFTVNGIFYNPLTEEVLDYVDGRADLERKVLRAIGDARARFREDHLRLLRAVRFATVLGFEIEADTWAAMKELAPEVASVSAERIREELVKIFLHPNRVRGFDLLVDSGLMKAVLPEILVLQGCEQPPQWHPEGDVFKHTRIMLDLLPEKVSLPLVLSVLFHDIAKPATFSVDETGRIRFNGHDKLGAEMTEEILRRLKFPNDVINPTVAAVANHMMFKDVQKMRISKLKRIMARPTYEDEMELHRVDCMSSNGLSDNYEFLRAKEIEFAAGEKPLLPKPLIDGHEVMSMGVPPGPRVGEILRTVQDLQLEGTLNSPEEAREWVRVNAL